MNSCVFCNLRDRETPLYEDALCFAVVSKDPVNKHHVLVIPKAHYEQFPDVPDDLAAHLFVVAKRMSRAVRLACHPDMITLISDDDISKGGFNQVAHYKVHIIPRFKRDIDVVNFERLRSPANDAERASFAEDVRRHLGLETGG